MDNDTADLLARVNAVAVSADELILASKEVHKIPAGMRNRKTRTHCVARLFQGQGYKAFAVHTRLQAMAALVSSGQLPLALVAEMRDGARLVVEQLFVAAAQEPILLAGEEPCFDADSFLEAVLRNSDVHGHA